MSGSYTLPLGCVLHLVYSSVQCSTEAAGRSVVSIIIDHIFFCIKDAGRFACGKLVFFQDSLLIIICEYRLLQYRFFLLRRFH